MHTTTWQMRIDLFEEEDRTRAEALLHTSAGTELRHTGLARRRPGDHDVPEIGDEVAVCRALSGIVHQLLDATLADLATNDPTREPSVRIE
jgi:hypothetical protein